MQSNNPSYKTLVIFSLNMHLSVFVFVFLAFLIPPVYGANVDKIVFYALTGFLVIPLFLIFLIPRLPEKYPQNNNNAPSFQNQYFYTLAGDEQQKKSRIILDYQNITRRTFAMTAARLGMAESFVVVGFVAQYLFGNPVLILPYAVTGLVLQIIFGPIVGRALSRKNTDSSALLS